MALSLQLFAQNSACDKVFDSYANTKGFLTMDISGNLLTELFSDGQDNEDCIISSLKILVVEDTLINPKPNFYKEVVPNLNRKEYEELMTVKSSDQDLVVLCKKQNHKITEFILVSGGSDNSLIYLKGSFSLSEARKISDTYIHSDKLKEMEAELKDTEKESQN